MENQIVICDKCRAEGRLGEGQFAGSKDLLDFAPVPSQSTRHDGWTPERQRGFIEVLARTGSVTQACKAVKKGRDSAYQLRARAGSAEFCAAWDAALDQGVNRMDDASVDRATNGVPVPIFYKGKQVGERRVFNERLTMWHLQHRRPEKYGASAARRGGDLSRSRRRRSRSPKRSRKSC